MALSSYTGDFGEPIRKMFASMVAQGQAEQTPTTPTGPTLPTYPTVTSTGPVAPTATTGAGATGTGWMAPTGAELGQQQVDYFKSPLASYAGMPIIQSELKGQLPDDVIQQISQVAAERGVQTGLAGSPAANSALLRAMGLTSYQMQQTGLSNLNKAYGVFPQLSPTATMQANLEAWKSVTGQNLQRQLKAEDASLKMALAQINANVSLTEQQRTIAAAQASQQAQFRQQQLLQKTELDAKARGDAAMAKAAADMLAAMRAQKTPQPAASATASGAYDPGSGLPLSPYVPGGTTETGKDEGTGEGYYYNPTPAATGGYYSNPSAWGPTEANLGSTVSPAATGGYYAPDYSETPAYTPQIPVSPSLYENFNYDEFGVPKATGDMEFLYPNYVIDWNR